MQSQNSRKAKNLLKILKHIWENCEYPDLIVFSKLQFILTRIYIDNENYRESNRQILLECVENHYGFLVDVVSKIVGCGVRNKQEKHKLLELYYKAKISIENKTYIQHTQMEDFANEMILVFARMWEINDDAGANEFNFLKTFLNENDPDNSLAFAEIYFIERKWKKALEQASIFQEHALENFGGEMF